MTDKAKGAADAARADRRNFLKFAGATVATGTTAVGATAAVAAPQEKPAADALYRETEHVRRYYDSAR